MIVFPMAGRSSRFFKAGYTVPKFMLPLAGKSLFQHTIEGFRSCFGREQFVFVHLNDDGVAEFIERELQAIGLKQDDFVLEGLPETTSGQAETVAVGCRAVELTDADSLTIFNIDTIRPDFQYPAVVCQDACDGYLEVFLGEGDHWSFVEPAKEDPSKSIAIDVAEKVRISDLCSTGLYYFRRASDFMDIYSTIENKPVEELQGGERYVAPMYKTLISSGKDIRYHTISSNEVMFSGTPDEYTQLRAQMER